MRAVAPGDRVVVPFQISCGTCERCRRGPTGDCRRCRRCRCTGSGPLGGDWGGALADLVRVPFADAMLVPLPDGVEPAASRARATTSSTAGGPSRRPLERCPGAEVLVIGGGARSIALYAVDAARALGARRVVYADTDPERLAVRRGARRRAA